MTAHPEQDRLGNDLTANERELADLHRRLHELADRTDLAPSTLMNVREAEVMLFNACNDLMLVPGAPASRPAPL